MKLSSAIFLALGLGLIVLGCEKGATSGATASASASASANATPAAKAATAEVASAKPEATAKSASAAANFAATAFPAKTLADYTIGLPTDGKIGKIGEDKSTLETPDYKLMITSAK